MQMAMLHAVRETFLPQLESKCFPRNFQALKSLRRIQNPTPWITKCELASLSGRVMIFVKSQTLTSAIQENGYHTHTLNSSADVNIIHRSRISGLGALERLRNKADQRTNVAVESTENDVSDGTHELDDGRESPKVPEFRSSCSIQPNFTSFHCCQLDILQHDYPIGCTAGRETVVRWCVSATPCGVSFLRNLWYSIEEGKNGTTHERYVAAESL